VLIAIRPGGRIHSEIEQNIGGTRFAVYSIMRRACTHALMSAGAVALLLLALVVMDDRVRDAVTVRVSTNPSAAVAGIGQTARDLTALIVEVGHDQSRAHAPLLVFSLASVILVIFMLRT